MKKIFLALFIIFPITSCTSLQKLNRDSQKDIETTGYVYEKQFSHSYKEVFLATVDVVHDWGATIFIKDYDEGIILGRDLGPNFSIPGKIFGFNLKQVNNIGTKVTLKVTRKSYGIGSAAPENVFDAIEKQIYFREKISQQE